MYLQMDEVGEGFISHLSECFPQVVAQDLDIWVLLVEWIPLVMQWSGTRNMIIEFGFVYVISWAHSIACYASTFGGGGMAKPIPCHCVSCWCLWP